MSSAGQAIGGVVGAVVGFFTPIGPMYGAQIGMMIGGVLDPPRTEGPRLEDLTTQTSVYGAFIPRLYGTTAVTGNVIWIQGDRLIERSVESDGKGGPVVTNFEYFATFAVGLCEGPIDGVRRIWIGGQLWYDAGSEDLSTIIASNEQAGLFTLYPGTDTQLADPLIQADRGAANVPAYRGLAYLVFETLPLKDYGNSLVGAQVKVEVVKNATLSSHLISNISLPDDTSWTNTAFKNAGNQLDSDGLVNFTVAKGGYPLWIKCATDGSILDQVVLSGPAVYPVATSVMPLTTSIDQLQYAFVTSNDYFAWGRKGSLATLRVPSATPVVLAENGGVMFVTWSLGATGFMAKVGIDSAYISSQISVYPEVPTVAVWGEYAVTAYRPLATGPTTVRIYEEIDGALTQVDTFTVSLAVGDDYLINGLEKSSYVDDDKLYIVAAIGIGVGVFAKITIIDLLARTLIGTFQVPESFGSITTQERPNVRVVGNLVFYGQRNVGYAAYGLVHNGWQIGRMTAGTTIGLSAIVESECLQSGLLTAGDIDVTELTDSVRGYRISSLAPLRGGIDQLRKAWPFDAIQHGYKIKFKKRGGASVATITEGELDAREAGANPGVRISNVREMDLILPQQLTVQYMDYSREYDVNTAQEERA